MGFLADEKIDVALLPIGDFFTMGPEDAVKAAEMIAPEYVIPMHTIPFLLLSRTRKNSKGCRGKRYMQS